VVEFRTYIVSFSTRPRVTTLLPVSKVAVVGHVEWVDFIPVARMPREGEVIHAEGHAFSRAAGGGGVVAVVLAELGAVVDFFCALGDDPHGHAAAEQLTERGVSTHVAWRTDEPTRRALTLLEDDGERTIVTVGERLQPRGSDGLPWDLLDDADGVYFTAGDLAALEHGRRARKVVASPRGRAALELGPTIDALVYSAGDHDEAEWARRLDGKARLLVETRGAEGGVWSGESEGAWKAVAPDGPVKDSYGCGDSFAAAFTFALADGRTVQEAADLGARWGARCLTRAGAP
jgi:ribokinase